MKGIDKKSSNVYVQIWIWIYFFNATVFLIKFHFYKLLYINIFWSFKTYCFCGFALYRFFSFKNSYEKKQFSIWFRFSFQYSYAYLCEMVLMLVFLMKKDNFYCFTIIRVMSYIIQFGERKNVSRRVRFLLRQMTSKCFKSENGVHSKWTQKKFLVLSFILFGVIEIDPWIH